MKKVLCLASAKIANGFAVLFDKNLVSKKMVIELPAQ
jgi:hypothetical protein